MAPDSHVARSALGLMLLLTTGCGTLSHYADPYQWRKLNRGPDYGRDTYNFSIPEPKQAEPPIQPVRGVALDLPNSRTLLRSSPMHD